jgi:hypothetical protein
MAAPIAVRSAEISTAGQEPELYYRGRAGAWYAPMKPVRKEDIHAGERYSPEWEAAVTALLALGGLADRAAASALGQMEPPCGCGCAQRQVPGLAAGWHKNKGPLPLLRAAGRAGEYQYPDWADHPYRIRGEDGRWTYVTEPYSTSRGDLADRPGWKHRAGTCSSVPSTPGTSPAAPPRS